MDRFEELAESLSSFFLVFDGLFLHENDTEQLLTEVQKSLEEKIQHNETALTLIIAVGGSYDSDVDRAKVEETKALLNLIKARKQLKEATEKASRKTTVNREVLALFGL